MHAYMNPYTVWCFPVSEADEDHQGESRIMETIYQPGCHYIEMQPLKISFVDARMDKRSRVQLRRNNLCVSELEEAHCLRI